MKHRLTLFVSVNVILTVVLKLIKTHYFSQKRENDRHSKKIQNNECGGTLKDKFEPVTRKRVFGVCDQVRLKPACSATEAS